MADNLSRALTDAKVKTAKPKDKPYKLSDGGGLFLLLQKNGTKLWRYKFRIHGKEGLLAIGAYPDIGLAAAREIHNAARVAVAKGENPVTIRKAERAEEQRLALLAIKGTFAAALREWKDIPRKPPLAASTVKQRDREIGKYLEPKFSSRRIQTISRLEMAALVKQVASSAPEVARNLRSYMFGIFEHAIDSGLIDANPVPPARIIGNRKEQKHHEVLPIEKLPSFLRALDNSTIRLGTRGAMLLTILTACRKNEATGARWIEFDLDAANWDIPKERMKGRIEHSVPLSRQAVELLRELHHFRTNDEFVFSHRNRPGCAMAERTLNAVVERLGFGECATPHGFRAMFSTHWNAAKENVDVIERCLAHVPSDKVRAAYNRYEYFDERRATLQKWADYIDEQRAKGLQEENTKAGVISSGAD